MQLEGYTLAGFDQGASLFKRAVWSAVSCLLFEPPWPLFSAIRVTALRLFGAEVGSGVVIRSKVTISHPWRLQVGDHVWIGEGALILSLARVSLESNVCISQRAFLCTGSHAFHSPGFNLLTKPITIRARSWVAAQAFIAPGIEIGPDSMVCAGSVVLANVPPAVTVRGNPAVATITPGRADPEVRQNPIL